MNKLPDHLKNDEKFRFKMCTRKRAYESELRAEQAALIVALSYYDPHIFPYPCPFCRQWHIGHDPRRKPRELVGTGEVKKPREKRRFKRRA
jgi:hypothetical protein